MVRWGLVGCGNVAERLRLPAFDIAQTSKLVAVTDVDDARVRAAADPRGVRGYSSAEELFGDPEVQAVVIATPPHLHAPLSVLAARRGKHVLCEKPMAITLGQCSDMIEAAKQANVLLGVAYALRQHPIHQKMAELVTSGALGRLVVMRTRYSVWSKLDRNPWVFDREKAGGGALMDIGCHAVDLMRMIMGEIVEVSGIADTLVHNYSVEDTASFVFRFASGAIGILELYNGIPNFVTRDVIEIYGSEGGAMVTGTLSRGYVEPLQMYSRSPDGPSSNAQWRPVNTRPIAGEKELYAAELDSFSRSVSERRSYAVSGEDAVRTSRVLAACYEASRERRVVQLSGM